MADQHRVTNVIVTGSEKSATSIKEVGNSKRTRSKGALMRTFAPTNVAWIQIPPSAAIIMQVEFVVGSLPCTERFFEYSSFSSLLKNQHFQIPIWSGKHRHL